jgi:chromosome segregation protein
MYLKSLEIAGFKSFAKKSILDFTSSISGIVGPNGSGKSNVAEGFRFVLGEQSIKSLRGKRGEDLIFNGGGDLGRQNRASVKVVFDNTKRVLNVDFDEVTLERVVHRDSSNEYRINGSLVRLKDIIELLAGAHIGASGHHIISQGEADKILNANLRERREMIEDALGLKIYQYKKQESQKKLEKTDENIKSVESLRREIAPHLKFLKKQVEKIEKTFEMKKSLAILYREYFKREEIYLKHERSRIEGERKAPSAELEKLGHELVLAKAQLAKSNTSDAKSTEIIDLETKIADTRVQKDSATLDLGRLEGQIAGLERMIAKEKSQQASEENKTIYMRDVESLANRIVSEIEAGEKQDSLSAVKDILDKVKSFVRDFVAHNRGVRDDALLKENEAEKGKLEESKKVLMEKVAMAVETLSQLQKEYISLKEAIDSEKDLNRDAEKNILISMARQNELHGMLGILKSQEDRLVLLEEDFKRELSEAYVLAGRETMDFQKHELFDGSGQVVSIEMVYAEVRQVQEERRKQIEKMKVRLEDAGGGNSEDVMKEYKEAEERDAFLARELEDLQKSAESLRGMIAELDVRLDTEFKQGILKINGQFQEYFSLMFGGGTASLEVVREKKKKRAEFDMDGNPLLSGELEEEGDEGVDIVVSLPRKKIKGLVMLSGGERALTSIALLFAVSQVNPPPFIILDETDAALDEANSKKYGDMIASLSKYSQLILITHNRETMSRAGVLYGVTMGSDGASKLLSIKFDEAVAVAK